MRSKKAKFPFNVGWVVLFLIAAPLACGSCRRDEALYSDSLLKMEGADYRDRELAPERIEEIRATIRRLKESVEQQVAATEQIGVYYKMLALKYMDATMYGNALESLDEARRIHPQNAILFYLSGICAGQLAESEYPPEQEVLYRRAEAHHLNALKYDPAYFDAMYALSILYVFELNRPYDAVPVLEKAVGLRSKDVDARFLLARTYVQTERYNDALRMYEEIASMTTVREKKEQALANKQQIEEFIDGTP